MEHSFFRDHIISHPSFISYTSDKEYRAQIRQIFRFDPTEKFTYHGKMTNFSDMDPVTQDELMFDNKKLSQSMDMLFEDTIAEPFFQDMYLHAAGQMFSTDLKIGQAVLCSYDTFGLYFACVWYFYAGGISGLLMCSEHQKLKSYFNL